MTAIEFLPEAREEFLAAALFYDMNSPKLGQELAAEVERILAMVIEHREIGLATAQSCRRVILRRFPFSVFYQIRGDVTYVVALAHQHRNPGYWRARVTP